MGNWDIGHGWLGRIVKLYNQILQLRTRMPYRAMHLITGSLKPAFLQFFCRLRVQFFTAFFLGIFAAKVHLKYIIV